MCHSASIRSDRNRFPITQNKSIHFARKSIRWISYHIISYNYIPHCGFCVMNFYLLSFWCLFAKVLLMGSLHRLYTHTTGKLWSMFNFKLNVKNTFYALRTSDTMVFSVHFYRLCEVIYWLFILTTKYFPFLRVHFSPVTAHFSTP